MPLAGRVMAVPARGRFRHGPLQVMKMWAASGSALVSRVTKEDIFGMARAFAMDELHYGTTAASMSGFQCQDDHHCSLGSGAGVRLEKNRGPSSVHHHGDSPGVSAEKGAQSSGRLMKDEADADQAPRAGF